MTFEVITKAIEEHGQAVVEMKEQLGNDMTELKERIGELEQKAVRRGGNGRDIIGGEDGDLAGTLMKSEQFQMLGKGAPSTGRVAMGAVGIKALTNAGLGVVGSTGFDVPAQRAAGIFNQPQRALSLLSVLSTLPVSGPSFEFLQLSGYTNSAAFQALEGDAKQEAAMPTELQQVGIATIAHWIRASTQVLDDAPALSQQIGSLLNYGLLAKLESEIVAGAGGTGKIKGLIDHATPFAPVGSPAPADAIGQAIVELSSNGWAAGVVVLNPKDWFGIASERATTGDGHYLIGSPRDPSPPNLWGVPVVTSPSLAAGAALVLDTSQVAVLDRMQPTILVSREDGSNFTSNLVTILAELRAGLAVFSPGAVLMIDMYAPVTG